MQPKPYIVASQAAYDRVVGLLNAEKRASDAALALALAEGNLQRLQMLESGPSADALSLQQRAVDAALSATASEGILLRLRMDALAGTAPHLLLQHRADAWVKERDTLNAELEELRAWKNRAMSEVRGLLDICCHFLRDTLSVSCSHLAACAMTLLRTKPCRTALTSFAEIAVARSTNALSVEQVQE